MKKGPTGAAALSEILKGLGGLVDKLSEIEAAGELPRSGRLRGVYGVQVKVGLGGRDIELEPFGHTGREAGPAAEAEVREPVCDVFEEDDCIVVIAEMPGVSEKDLQFALDGNRLRLSAATANRSYAKELELPAAVEAARIRVTANNGVVELRCPR
jgi:HSP20 family protein